MCIMAQKQIAVRTVISSPSSLPWIIEGAHNRELSENNYSSYARSATFKEQFPWLLTLLGGEGFQIVRYKFGQSVPAESINRVGHYAVVAYT